MGFLHEHGLNDREKWILEKLKTYFRKGSYWQRDARVGESKREFYERALEELKNEIVKEVKEQGHGYIRYLKEAIERLDIELTGKGESQSGTIGRKTIVRQIQDIISRSPDFQDLLIREEYQLADGG